MSTQGPFSPPSSPSLFHSIYSIPTPRVGLLNAQGYSVDATDRRLINRRRKLVANIRAIMKHVDVLCLVETKLQADFFRHQFRRDWCSYANPYYVLDKDPATGRFARRYVAAGGCEIYVRISFARNFHVDHTIVTPGHIHYVSFTPREVTDEAFPVFTKSFAIVNCYVPPNKHKRSTLRAFQNHNFSSDYLIACGDWNVTTLTSDSSTGNRSSRLDRKALDDAVNDHGMHEVYHPAKTKLSKHAIPHASRLDKFFISHTDAEQLFMVPSVWLPPHPYEPGKDPNSPSDHFAVALHFAPPGRATGKSFSIPTWVAKLPSYATEVTKMWDLRDVPDNPCDALAEFDSVLIAVARNMTRRRRHNTQDRVDAVSMALSVYHKILRGKVTFGEAIEHCRLNERLREVVMGCDGFLDLRSTLENYVTTTPHTDEANSSAYREVRATYHRNVSSFVPKSPVTGRDYNTNIKACLAPNAKLDFLIDEKGGRIDSPSEVAKELKLAWEPIWTGSPASASMIKRYLRSYDKKIGASICRPTIDDVIAEVANPKSTCSGPNGIPFYCYAVLCSIAAPLILKVILHLMDGGAPKKGFNWCTLFFLPKDGSKSSKAMRPIAASNTNNRIIANILRRKIEPHVLGILDRNQTGFVRGRLIEENIRFYNEQFYSALYTRYSRLYPGPDLYYPYGDGKWFSQKDCPNPPNPRDARDYYILFLDFAKAFDSVSRKFLMAILEHVGIPLSYRNIIWALLADVRATPCVPGSADDPVYIMMRDGLKQGCSLSPLLFILVIDPLISALATLPKVQPRCFAGASRLRKLAPCLSLSPCGLIVLCRAAPPHGPTSLAIAHLACTILNKLLLLIHVNKPHPPPSPPPPAPPPLLLFEHRMVV